MVKYKYQQYNELLPEDLAKSSIFALHCIPRNFTYVYIRFIPRDWRRLDLELFVLFSKATFCECIMFEMAKIIIGVLMVGAVFDAGEMSWIAILWGLKVLSFKF